MSKEGKFTLEPDAFDAIYLKGITASASYADSPAKRQHYANGFNQAVELFHQYLADEKVDLEEAERRAGIISKCLLEGNQSASFNKQKKGD